MAIDICILAFMVNPCLICILIKHGKRRAKLAGATFLKAEGDKAWHVISHPNNRIVTPAPITAASVLLGGLFACVGLWLARLHGFKWLFKCGFFLGCPFFQKGRRNIQTRDFLLDQCLDCGECFSSRFAQIMNALPERPARPVRPIRCT